MYHAVLALNSSPVARSKHTTRAAAARALSRLMTEARMSKTRFEHAGVVLPNDGVMSLHSACGNHDALVSPTVAASILKACH